MKSKDIYLIKLLLTRKGEDTNISQMANALGMDYKNAHGITQRLAKGGIITLERFGKSSKVVLQNTCNPLIFEAEYERRRELLKNKNFKVLLGYFDRNIRTKFYVMMLFGSYAKGTKTKNSDIDLLFIVPDNGTQQCEREIRKTAALVPLNLHITVVPEKDFIAMKESRQDTVVSEAIRNNVLLRGIEDYYGLMQ